MSQDVNLNELNLGDEVVYDNENHPRIVICTYNGWAIQKTSNGEWKIDLISKLHKTGRNFDFVKKCWNRRKERTKNDCIYSN